MNDNGPEPDLRRSRNIGILTTAGAVISAVLSSACCWLPVLLIAFGASAAGLSGFFDTYRLYFLSVTAILLATSFYLVYFRKQKCGPGNACAVPNPKLVLFSKVMLWVAAAVVLLFALFPNYFGLLAGKRNGETGNMTNPDELRLVELRITGMTCQACGVHVQRALSKVAGVSSAEVSYKRKAASLIVPEGAEIPREAILEAIANAGYMGSFIDEADTSIKQEEEEQ